MPLHPLAGKPAPESLRVNIPRLITAYYANRPDPADPSHRVAFGTSGHRGNSFKGSFNEAHILAITQAVCQCRAANGVTGPLFLGNGHARIVRTGPGLSAGGAGRQRRDRHDPGRFRLYAHPGHLPRHPDLQQGAGIGAGRRHCHHSVPQPAGQRGIQIQPPPGRARRHRRDQGHRNPSQRTARLRQPGRAPDPL